MSLKEWKIVITLVRQEYEFTGKKQDYRTGLVITYRGRGLELSINIGKAKDNYNKDRKPRYFNYNIYEHMVKDFKKLKKEKETRKCYKCNKVEYLAKNCSLE